MTPSWRRRTATRDSSRVTGRPPGLSNSVPSRSWNSPPGDCSTPRICWKTFAVADHFAVQYAPMQLLQYAADHTSRIRLATLVLSNDFRHPTVLAKEAAILDVLSGGRLELGLVAGWLLQEYRQAGLAFQDAPTR